MRSYPRNSPEAAARIVALVLIADGHVCRSEFDVFERLDGPRELGLQSDSLPRIVQTLCEDLLHGRPWQRFDAGRRGRQQPWHR